MNGSEKVKRNYDNIYSYNFLIPCVVIYGMFFVLPALMGVYYSFFHWDFFNDRFAGLYNYINILSNKYLRVAIKNTLLFATITSVFKMIIGLALAVILNRNFRSKTFLRTVFFMPSIMNNVAVGIAFVAIMYPTGILNDFFVSTGLDFLAQNWLTNPDLAIYSVSFIEIWKWSGFVMVILLGGLQSVAQEYYEAAEIDGANAWQKFRGITLPLIMPAFNNALVLSIIGGLKVFDIIIATTKGGPGKATAVMNTLIFEAFGAGRYGEASAGNVILSLIIGVIAITIYRRIAKREVVL